MSRSAVLAGSLIWGLLSPVAAVHAAMETDPAAIEPQVEETALRERITDREDKRRPRKPFSVTVGEHPLILGGEYEFAPDYLQRHTLGATASPSDRSRLEQQLELEAFYSLGLPLSAFAQVQLKSEMDLISNRSQQPSGFYLERSEMWLYSEHLFGSDFDLDVGRLDYEDDRRWWWDDELDSVRIAHETGPIEWTLALAQELAPNRSGRDEVDASQQRVQRWIGEASWDYRPNHAVQFFFLRQQDHSTTENPGQEIPLQREDESDARLTWLGGRLTGAFELSSKAVLGYWLDAARVRGNEQRIEYGAAATPGHSRVLTVVRQNVSGWGLDAGCSAILPTAGEPRLYAGYAYGSGDAIPGDAHDHSFRQTGLQANQAGFGGAERFEHYGVLLNPELSNLRILSIGAGFSLLQSSSLDLVYHDYRLVRPAASLRDSRLNLTLTGLQRGLGSGLDAVLAIEEWERFELSFVATAFKAGPALGADQGRWSSAGFLALRFAF